ncbi:unnamed protein product [Diabrotica balteata]|uniref:Peptidase M14 domain-containing protein n=1 Tax=Diabrotica balteata TaxID=107213 RepID=A0A9N9SVH1_DIABA|nr:unnamed protein product [Diabrotica balteata]
MARKKRTCAPKKIQKRNKIKHKLLTKPTKYTFNPNNVTRFRCPITCEKFFQKFLTYDEITEYLKSLQKRFRKKFHLEEIGKSTEKRSIYMVIITNNLKDREKMAVLVEAGSDGSNILAVASALYLINFLTKNQGLVKIMDYYILPCSNPDAYDMIIKNISPNGTVPVNLANNFPIILGAKTLQDVTTQDFVDALEEWKINLRFSSPVTKAIIKSVAYTQKHVKLFISLQEGGSSLVFPFGSSSEVLNDEEELATMAKSVQRVLKNINIDIGSLYKICGLTFGSVIDFLKFHCGDIKFTYIFHIKDNEQETSIRDVLVYGEDIFNCVKSLARNVYMYYNKLNPNKNKCK